ncbi:Nucleoside-diphosphate-sugar epimerase [Sphingomonas sp. YR710]|uniref:NAD-dependent epimerase/dehydratase family protein n=1 Tax=Sphingomonas sp. YR710 TaxID=1882773 RepID=UPI0008801C4A|nr:NAD(P)-dependent oxidoreductase [Sphingomonas sp. YR710]SDC09880.1 Nucleoside-diphosphate-sugar epimerase [Sphingomonas sp. YR710]
MRLLLTGSSGWLARFLATRLRASGHDVLGIDVVPGANTDIIGSVADRLLIDRTFGDYGIEAVIHAGALHKPDIARFAAQAFIDVNVTGTLNLLEAAAEAGHDRFLFTSTTSLMITDAIRDEAGPSAIWLDEDFGPLAPRNIYGVTKLAAEGLCRLYHRDHGLACMILRTGRFFPEDDDTIDALDGPNLKANEFLNRRLTVEDAAEAHLLALDRAPALGCETFVLSAPIAFARGDGPALKQDAAAVIARYYPEAADLYAARGWRLPASIGRIYDPGRAERLLGFRARTDFGSILAALRDGRPLPFAHDPGYVSPVTRGARPV